MCDHAPNRGREVGRRSSRKEGAVLGLLFGNVALWQGLGLVLLICVVWANAILALPNLLYGRPPSVLDWTGASILTAGICIVGFITVAHTYLLQQHILKGIIIVCSYCNKVKMEESQWERMERYLAGKTLAKFSHGVCPDCYDVIQADYELDDVADLLPEPESRAKTVA